MTDENQPAATNSADTQTPVVNPQAVYVKDASFEAPNGPFLQGANGNPTVNLNLGTRTTALAPELPSPFPFRDGSSLTASVASRRHSQRTAP